MTFIIVTALLLVQNAPQQGKLPPSAQPTALTLSGCVQETGDKDVFLISIPNVAPPRSDVAAGTRGVNSGASGTSGAGNPAGSKANDGTARNPTMENRTYKLTGLEGAILRPLVSRAVEVIGELLPTASSPQGTQPINPVFHAKSIRKIADSCADIIRK